MASIKEERTELTNKLPQHATVRQKDLIIECLQHSDYIRLPEMLKWSATFENLNQKENFTKDM